MNDKPQPNLKFESKEEFRATLQLLSARLGYLNRVAIGESYFVIAVSDMLTKLGRVFDEHLKDSETSAAFGDGYSKGTIEREDRARALFELMYPSEEERQRP